MTVLKVCLALAVLLALASCRDPFSIMGGAIQGRVVWEDDSPCIGARISLAQSMVVALADSEGSFDLQGIQAGSVSIRILSIGIDTTISGIEIPEGQTITIPNIRIPKRVAILVSFIERVTMPSTEVLDKGGQYLFWTKLDSLPQSNIVYSGIDAFRLRFVLQKKINGIPAGPWTGRVRILQNDAPVLDTLVQNGIMATPPLRRQAPDRFEILTDSMSMGGFVLADSADRRTSALRLRTGPSSLTKKTLGTEERNVLLGGDPFLIQYIDTARVNWGILLVNCSTGDTCWWQRPLLEWGALNRQDDNPVYVSGQPFSSTLYRASEIRCPDLPDGEYLVLVQNLAGSAAPVQLNIELGEIGFNQIGQYVSMTSPRVLAQGEQWMAARLVLPAQTIYGVTSSAPGLPAGSIKGRILWGADSVLMGAGVTIAYENGGRTMLYGNGVLTDSAGCFTLSGLPPGRGRILVRVTGIDTAIGGIDIVEGDTVSIGTIRLPMEITHSVLARETDTVSSFNVVDDNGNALLWAKLGPDPSLNPVYFGIDAFRLRFVLQKKINGIPAGPWTGRVRILQNEAPVVDTLIQNGILVTPPLRRQAPDRFEILTDTLSMGGFVLADSADRRTSALRLRAGPSSLTKKTLGTEERHVMMEGDPFLIRYVDTARVNWGLLLVNCSTGDTCWWQRPLREWGALDRQDDNPAYVSGLPFSSTLYRASEIRCPDLPDGEYLVLVQNLAGAAAPVQLNIELGETGFNQIAHYWTITSPQPLAQGGFWTVGKIKIPELTLYSISGP